MTTKHEYRFDSIGELVEAIGAAPKIERNDPTNHIFSGGNRPDWFCEHRKVGSLDDVRGHLSAQTFEPGVTQVSELAAQLSAPTPVSRRRKPIRAAEGDELDMGRVWQGDLEHAWRNTKREQSVGPSRVLVAVQINAHAGVSAERLAWRGATALAYTNALLDAGFAVELIACTRNDLLDDTRTHYSCDVTLLPAGGQLDIHKLASLVASGLLFRGVILPHELIVSEKNLDYGISQNRGALTASQLDGTGFDYVAVIGEKQETQCDAERWLKTNIEALDTSRERAA
jgi:hypothetical protein